MTKSQTPRVQSKSTKKRNLKASADDSSDGQNEKIKQMKVKTTEKKADTEDCEVNVQKDDGLKPKKAQRKEKKKTESTEKIKTQRKRKAESSGDQELEDEDGSDGMEDLTPEEKRVLERKLKKIRKKEEKKNMKAAVSATQEENKTNVAEKLALEYLTCWSERKDEWKFQKTRQTWLLQNMYDSEKVPDRYFKVLLAYLEGLKGTAKEKTLQKAEALVRWEGQGDEDAEVEEKKKYRAKMIMQQL